MTAMASKRRLLDRQLKAIAAKDSCAWTDDEREMAAELLAKRRELRTALAVIRRHGLRDEFHRRLKPSSAPPG